MALALLKGTIKDCTPVGSIATVNSMGINPVNPQPGDNSTIWVVYDLSKEVTGGSVKYSYWLNFIPFQPTTIDICSQESCPIQPGCYNSSGSSDFPDIAGRIEAKVEWFNQDENPIWCVDTFYSV